MDERERKRRKERERRADEAFFDGLLLGHYFWRERNESEALRGRRFDSWDDGLEDVNHDDEFGDELDMMDDWD